MVIGKRLNSYVREREELSKQNPFTGCPFGLETEGRWVNRWELNYRRIGFYVRAHRIGDFDAGSLVQMYVPRTESGVEPLNADEQPFGWDGKINENTADCAVWWAFELLTENEAGEFKRIHKPAVIFHYIDKGSPAELAVRFNGIEWIAERDESV